MTYNTETKTLVITVNRAIIVRNILLHPVFKKLQKEYHVVLLVPKNQKQKIQNMFPDCSVEILYPRVLIGFLQKCDQIFVAIRKALIYNPTTELRTKYGLLRRSDVPFKRLRHGVQKYFFGMFLSKIPGIIWFCNFIDRFVVGTNEYDFIIEKYKPEALFVTNIADDEEVAILLNFKKRGIRTIAMVKSWDSTSKFLFRGKADFVFAWGEYQKQEFCLFQGYDPEQIHIIGVPQFDYYSQFTLCSRESFVQLYGMDSRKKILFFGSEGPIFPDEESIIKKLHKEIFYGRLPGYQILVRPHFGYKNQIERFKRLADGKTIFVDSEFFSSSFRDGTELGINHLRRLSEQIRHSDVVITSASTLALDSLAHGVCPLLCGFDENPNTPIKDSVRRLYDTRWFREFQFFGLNNIMKTFDELVETILLFPGYTKSKKEIQEKILLYFCKSLDGKSGERLRHAIIKSLSRV